ncbi:MAG: serine/threonine protein kinase, partial [Candidatus Aminicenantes bacterium]|nr:serine/threonine protein kinase [Candidatus Aminicenantes bacterium]
DVDEVSGTTFIAMEFVEGKTVSQLIDKRELDLIGSVEIALQVTEGLSKAHEANIVHRDIKSDNIMVTRDGHAKLLDFGLAKLLDPVSADEESDIQGVKETETFSHTRPGTVMGTAAYMSPEQARGLPVNQASDVFSMGVVLYEMVTGELPFKGDTPLDTMHSIAFDEARPVTVIRQNLPPELHRIVSRCLRKKPGDRYRNARVLAADLKRLKHDIESGIQRSIPAGERVRMFFEGIKTSLPFGPTGVAIAVIGLALAALIAFTKLETGAIVGIGILALIIYRYVRNRKNRMLKRFTSKISKFPEVKAIVRRDDHITIVVEEAKAKTYIRINSLVDMVNKKLYFGKNIEASVRDDLSPDEFQHLLRGPSVTYIRDDVVFKSKEE